MPDDPSPPPVDDDGFVSKDAAPPLPGWGAESFDQRMTRLRERARKLSQTPGVYLMKDHKGVVIYVGKALRLPDRVSSYFIPSADLGGRKQPMLDVVHDFDVLLCESEWEALLAENRLIKDIKPRFNARLMDNTTFPYLVVTVRDDFPRVEITRDPQAHEFKGAKVFGPFVNSRALSEAMLFLQRIFKFRTCSLDIIADAPANRTFRPCILYNIGQCTAPCGAKISLEAYRTDINAFVRFLGTKQSVMLREMREEMAKASSELRFERAGVLRDQIKAIEKLEARGTIRDGWQPEAESYIIEPGKALQSLQRTLDMDAAIRCIEAIDIAHLQGNETVGSKVCFVDGRPLRSEYRRFRIRGDSNGGMGGFDPDFQGAKPGINDDYSSIREVVSRRYREAGEGNELYPEVILIDGGLGQLHAALEAFDSLDVRPPMVISLAKKEELIYVQRRSEPIRLGRENPGLRLCQAIRDEAHRFAQHYHHVLRRKRTLEEE